MGDRDASGILGCKGAPAIVEGRVFGLVSECAAGRTPSITPLSAARSFLSRNVPGWRLDLVAPAGSTLFGPVSPNEVLMRPDEGDGLIEITRVPMVAWLESAAHAATWESKHDGPNQLLLMKRARRNVDLEGEYLGEGVLAKARFVRMSDRWYVFLGVFLSDDFGRGEATFNRLVQSWTEHEWHGWCTRLHTGGIS